jgi:hypothetical protein
MAKIHLKTLVDPESYTPWKEWFDGWIPDDTDLVMEKYDTESGEGGNVTSIRRVPTNGESNISAPSQRRVASAAPMIPTRIPFTRFSRPAPPVADIFAARRAAARESFNKQVAEARAHVANDILSKLGNGR